MYFVFLGEWKRLVHPPNTIACAKAHCCKLKILGKVPRKFWHIFKVYGGNFWRTSFVKCERSDRIQPGKVLKIIERVAVRSDFAKYHRLYIWGSSSLRAADVFSLGRYHPKFFRSKIFIRIYLIYFVVDNEFCCV